MEQGRSQSLRLQSKLMPRDISESLAKLPPQALDLEAVVIGAVMLEKGAIEKVPFLRSQHFYDERHATVFSAIERLQQKNEPLDFRMVIKELRNTGHLDLIGGPTVVIELTHGVQSSAHLDHHARIIIEMYLRREMIQRATRIHQDVYGDVDIIDYLDRTLEDLKFLREKEVTTNQEEKIKSLWEKLAVTVKPERPETLIKLGEADVCTVGNVSLLIGKKKSRKSLLTVHLLSIFLKNRNNVGDEIVIFDTEQEEFDVWQTRDRLYRMTNQYVPVFCLRGLSPKERRDFIEQTVTYWPTKLRIGVIDGIRDCMSNINDPDETTEVMSWLMRMNVETKIHFINILHQNKTDNNARGHIGTELLNKAEVTIEVLYDDQTTHSIVKCESSRRKPFDNFAFTHGATGLPEVVGVPMKEQMAQDDQIDRLEAVFEGEALKHKDLLIAMKAQFSVGESKAKQLIADYVRRGWVIKSGKDRSPTTTYKLMVEKSKSYTPPPVVHQNPQISLDLPQNNSFNSVTNPPSEEDELPF